jgi:EPS-associated MarR family transcriptional regulator
MPGVSTGSICYCLNALIVKGWVKVHNFSKSKNKFGYVYLVTTSDVAKKAALTGRFLQRMLREYNEMRAEIESLTGEINMGSLVYEVFEGPITLSNIEVGKS